MTELVVDAAAATPGQRLKAAREKRGLSSQKAADQMHLDPWVIEALESDQFDKIGPTVYAKGHLKRYAGMLGLPAADIMDAAYGVPAAAAASAAPRGGIRLRTQEAVGRELPWSVIFGAALVAAVILGAVWLRPWRPRVASAPAGADQPRAAQSASDATPVGVPRSAGDAAAEPSGESSNDAAEDAAAAATQAPVPLAVVARGSMAAAAAPPGHAAASVLAGAGAPAGLPPLGAGKARLRLSFSADSRVEVRDANGNPVFAGNGRANSVKTVVGDAPLRVYLGFASGVQLAVNNRVVAIGPQFVAGDVARFEAGADGVLRRDTHAVPSSAAVPQTRPRG